MSVVRVRWGYVVPIILLMLLVFWYMLQPYILPSVVLTALTLQRSGRARDDESGTRACRAYNCFAINKCAYREQDKVGVYVSPLYSFVDEAARTVLTPEISREYAELLGAIRTSPYNEPDQSKACVTLPHVDTLNGNTMDMNTVSDMLRSLPGWMNGENHILFFMLPSAQTQSFVPGYAMVAGGGFPRSQYREGLDISTPVFNPLTFDVRYPPRAIHSARPHLFTVLSRDGSFPDMTLSGATHSGMMLLHLCPDSVVSPDLAPWKRCTSSHEVVDYPSVLLSSRFCMIVAVADGFEFTDVMMSGCIPVVLGDDHLLPFSEGIDWSRASVRLWLEDLQHVPENLLGYPEEEMREQVLFLYQKYFSSMSTIALTTMKILDERVFPDHISSYESWNNAPNHPSKPYNFKYSSPRLLAAPTAGGFTTVLVVRSKYKLTQVNDIIKTVAMATDLAKVLIVWTDTLSLPSEEVWPRIAKPIQIVIPLENVWNYRFFPYAEIDTLAVLLIMTDDMLTLTSEEIQFGYKVWYQFPDRQIHVGYSSSGREGNGLIAVQATFHHTYYHYHFTHLLPRGIDDWLGGHTDCHDVAMELLIANYTGLPPIKVRAKHKSSPSPSPLLLTGTRVEEGRERRCFFLLSGFISTPLVPDNASLIFDA